MTKLKHEYYKLIEEKKTFEIQLGAVNKNLLQVFKTNLLKEFIIFFYFQVSESLSEAGQTADVQREKIVNYFKHFSSNKFLFILFRLLWNVNLKLELKDMKCNYQH